MKNLACVTALCLAFCVAGATSVWSQAQSPEDYTIVNGVMGPQVCLGKWVPPKDISLPGTCEGQIIDIAQLTAVSSRQSVVELDRILRVLVSIDEKLAVNNKQVNDLVRTAANAETSAEQRRRSRELLLEIISKRFDALPKEIMSNDLFKKEIAKLKDDILKEIEQQYPARPK